MSIKAGVYSSLKDRCFPKIMFCFAKGTRFLSTVATCWSCGLITKLFGELTLQHFRFKLLILNVTSQRLTFSYIEFKFVFNR